MGLIIDNFAGGGGASTGIEAAMGRPVDIAINHDADAIAMHKINHPHTKHYCEDVWTVDPLEACKGRPVDLAWFSPDCKHFSKAKGGKPVDKKIRGLAWVAVKWAKLVHPKVIILENVEEFQTWGPIIDGYPDPAQRGHTFRLFIKALEKFGYAVDYCELTASDYGAPTSRKRFFLVARCDGESITWPTPSHGDPDRINVRAGMTKPWRTAAEIIDWSIPCPSIFERIKPLCEATMRRIARGLQKFVLDDPRPFVLAIGQQKFGGNGRVRKANEPLSTIVTKAEHCLVTPYIAQTFGGGYDGAGRKADKPLPTVTAVDHSCLIEPYLIQYHSYSPEARGQSLKRPLLTQDTSNRYAIVAPYMMHLYGTSTGASVKKPVSTITAIGQHIAEVHAFLVKYYGQGDAQSLKEPLATITAHDRFGLVTVMGEPYQIVDIGMRMLVPRELFDAQGFPHDYIIDRDHNGKPMTKKAQVARVGNSVCPAMAEAIVRANISARLEAFA